MALLMDGLLIVATLFAGGYCWVLSRRVNDLKALDRGIGGAIVTLTRKIELARTTLDEARASTTETRQALTQLTGRAETAATQLRLLLAAAPPIETVRPPREPVREQVREPAREPVREREAAAPPARVETAAAEPGAETRRRRAAAIEVPKPAILPPGESPLRRRGGADPERMDEIDVLEALRELASGGGR